MLQPERRRGEGPDEVARRLGRGLGGGRGDRLQLFGQAQLLTAGGPSGGSRTMVLFIYEAAFGRWELGYASAAAEVLFLLILAVTLTQYWATSRMSEGRRG